MLDSVGDALALTAARYPDKTALIEAGGERFTYDRLNHRVNRLANRPYSKTNFRMDPSA